MYQLGVLWASAGFTNVLGVICASGRQLWWPWLVSLTGLGVDWLLIDLGWPWLGLVGFPLHGISSSSKLAWICSHGCQSSKKANGKMKGLVMPRLRTDILSLPRHLMGQNKSASPDSRMGNRLHFSWEELQGCVAEGMNSGKRIIGAILLSICHRQQPWLCWKTQCLPSKCCHITSPLSYGLCCEWAYQVLWKGPWCQAPVTFCRLFCRESVFPFAQNESQPNQ